MTLLSLQTAWGNAVSEQDERQGGSAEDAIPIHAESTDDGIRLEYEWLEDHYGKQGLDWTMLMQSLNFEDDRPYDVLHIRLADGAEKRIYFDISGFFGKF